MLQQILFPSRQPGPRPIAVDPLDAGRPIIRYLREQAIDDAGLGIIGIDKNG